uniref:Putative synaptic vesicle transporter svop n=1 Tax=Nyssomyia neivai TaxID=330878 RepID=A0A1L8DEA8_9DIPT
MLEETDQQKFDLNLILEQIGPFGKFQFKLFSLICISSFVASTNFLLFIFTAREIDYRCKIPQCDTNSSIIDASYLNFTVPVDQNGFSKCIKYQTYSNISGELEDQCYPSFFNPNQVESCSEFIYQDDEVTIQNEWDLGCSEDWKLSLVGTVNNIGQLVCLLLAGYFSDRFGRQKAFLWSVLFAAFLGLIRSFSTNYIMFIILEFLEPALGSGFFSIGFVLGMEHIGTSKRVFWAFFPTVFCVFGVAGLGVTAMLTKNWRLLMRILYVPSFFLASYRWLIPESTRWLISKNKIFDAAKIFASIVKLNQTELTMEAKDMLNQALNEETSVKLNKEVHCKRSTNRNPSIKPKENKLKTFLKSRKMVLRFINCSLSWTATLFVFTGLSMTSVFLDGDIYVNFILMCVIGIPGCMLTFWLMDKFGRRRVLSFSYLACGAACIAFVFFKGNTVALQILFLIAKFTVGMSYTTINFFTAELFPTELRQSLHGWCSVFGHIGSILAPFTLYLAKYMESMDMILFAAFVIPAGIFILYAPETRNKPLPDTMQEAENL